jgi:hypothetical protein
VSPSPATHVLIVTAAHGFPFVPAFHVDPTEHDAHTPLLVFVAGVSPLPVVHEVIVTGEHGALPDGDHVEPTTHAYKERRRYKRRRKGCQMGC